MYKIEKSSLKGIQELRNIPGADEFSRDFLNLWEEHNRQGSIITARTGAGEIAGFCLLEEVGRVCPKGGIDHLQFVIRGMWVERKHYREGIGSGLVRNVLDLALKGESPEELPRLVVVNITPGANEFYVKVGFHLAGIREDVKPNMVVRYWTTEEDARVWMPYIRDRFHVYELKDEKESLGKS